MTTLGRLSSCARCGSTIEYRPGGYGHIAAVRDDHRPEPDDSRVDGPDHSDVCDGDCDDCLEDA